MGGIRSRARFLEVAATINPSLYPQTAALFALACRCIRSGSDLFESIEDDLVTRLYHESPHIRSLAAEALFYAASRSPTNDVKGQ